jgi:hypothetical protein
LLVEASMQCIVIVPDGDAYVRTRPDRCYADAAEARRDGCLP